MSYAPNQQRPYDPNFKICNFCKNDHNRQDKLRFTHWLHDRETGEVCPFLMTIICQICLERGHTTNRCPNQTKLDEMYMRALCLGESNSNNERLFMEGKMARMEFEDELMRRNHMQWYQNLEKSCQFCVKFGDEYHRTHILKNCPRLACMTCQHCGQKGHTRSKCEVLGWEETMRKPIDPAYVLDFSNV